MDASRVKQTWSLAASELSVHLRANGRPLLSDASFEVGQNELLVVVGESGAGKTMLARALVGYLPRGVEIRKGTVNVRTQSGSDQGGRNQAPSVALVPQAPQDVLPPLLSVSRFVQQVVQFHHRVSPDEAGSISEALLSDAGFPTDPATRQDRPFQLSGGMAQRAAVAAALATHPAFLILDEPTSALDPIAGRALIGLVKKLHQERGVGVILMTHDLDSAFRLASRCIVLREGRIYADGKLADLISDDDPYLSSLFSQALADGSFEAG